MSSTGDQQGNTALAAAQAERLHRFAHDLKNRLGGMAACLRMLTELPEGPERDEVMAHAEKAYFKALYELERTLDDLGVDRLPKPGPTAPVDTAALVERITRELAYRFDRKRQQLHVDIPAGHALHGDADLLHLVLTTFLSNASKFGAEGSTIRVVADGGRVQVTDTGAGLSADDLAEVFKPFAWLSSRSTAGEEQGRGSLGRAWRAAQAMGLELQATSEGPGKGCTFTVRAR